MSQRIDLRRPPVTDFAARRAAMAKSGRMGRPVQIDMFNENKYLRARDLIGESFVIHGVLFQESRFDRDKETAIVTLERESQPGIRHEVYMGQFRVLQALHALTDEDLAADVYTLREDRNGRQFNGYYPVELARVDNNPFDEDAPAPRGGKSA